MATDIANTSAPTTTTTTRCGVYPCSHHLGSGHVFIGSSAVSFVNAASHKRIIGPIEFDDIVEVKDLSQKDCICIVTTSGDEWVFDSFNTQQKETVLKTLTQASSSKSRSSSLTLDDTVVDEKENNDSATTLLPRSNSLPSFTKHHDGIVPVEPVPEEKEEDPMLAAMADLGNASFSIRQQIRQESTTTNKRPSLDRRKEETVTKSMRLLSMVSKDKTPEQLKKLWMQLQNDKSISNVAVESVELSCPFDQFYKTFWSGNAIHPISSYQEKEVGDTDIETLEWMSKGDGLSLCRSIEYMHPSTAPMGPPMARTTKEQVLQKYGTHGMVLQTTTQVEDVPMADCFVLEDRILVEPSSSSCGQHKTTKIKCCFNVKFVKSTMWKKIISSNAKKGITAWMEGYVKYLQKEAKGLQSSIKE